MLEILTINSRCTRHNLKNRLLSEGLLKNECSECSLSEKWNGKEIKMVLDHINGVNNDNRIENLRMLCPNCNSQQSTFCRWQGSFIKSRHPDEFLKHEESKRNKCSCGEGIFRTSSMCNKCKGIKMRKTDRPTKEELEGMIKTMTWVDIGKRHGVSDSTVRKWAKNYGLI